MTLIIFTVQVESRECDSQPSSSNMISFDLSNSSNVPAGSVDDDEYVEYSLDMLADFPTNVEEEERVKKSPHFLQTMTIFLFPSA